MLYDLLTLYDRGKGEKQYVNIFVLLLFGELESLVNVLSDPFELECIPGELLRL